MALKLSQTSRLDSSDTFVHARGAPACEWAETGTFLFFGADPAAFAGEECQAFRGDLPGINGFRWSTRIVVTEASVEEHAAVAERLTGQLIAHCGAPDLTRARAAAKEEVAFAQTLCDNLPNALFGMHFGAEGDGLPKIIHTLHQRGGLPASIYPFRIVAADAEDTEGKSIDFAALTQGDVRR